MLYVHWESGACQQDGYIKKEATEEKKRKVQIQSWFLKAFKKKKKELLYNKLKEQWCVQ